MSVRAVGLLGLALLSAGCARDLCKEKQPSLELDIFAPQVMGLRSLGVTLTIGADTWTRRYELDDQLSDGQTSLVINLDPPPTEEFDAEITVVGRDTRGATLVEKIARFHGTPDACNIFELTLGEGRDGGTGADG